MFTISKLRNTQCAMCLKMQGITGVRVYILYLFVTLVFSASTYRLTYVAMVVDKLIVMNKVLRFYKGVYSVFQKHIIGRIKSVDLRH